MRIQNSKPKWLEDHVERILKGADLFKIDLNKDEVFSVVEAVLKSNEFKEARVRIILHENGSLETTIEPFEDADKPFKLSFKEIDEPQGAHKLWPFKKHTENEGEEVILIEKETGFVLEGSYTNVFVKTDNGYITPPADGKIVEGIGRKYFIRELQEKGEIVKEEWFKADLLKNNEVILTNALRGVIGTKEGCLYIL